MNQKTAVAFMLALLFLALATVQCAGFASANPDGSSPALSMPIEHINYTITRVNGTLWAKIDGNYPISIQTEPDCELGGDLPMVYPMPPQTTNIHVWLGDRELSWSNYTETYPEGLHHTAIGDWWMIYTVLPEVSGSFVVKIHYEHPLERVNSSYLFLYDLNISPYLSPEDSGSTAYFAVRMEANTTNVRAYTTGMSDAQGDWNSTEYTVTKQDGTDVFAIELHSEYNRLLGDLVVVFSDADEIPEFGLWAVATLAVVLLLAAVLYVKRRAVGSSLGLSKTAIQSNPKV
jgi:hypothetical protein